MNVIQKSRTATPNPVKVVIEPRVTDRDPDKYERRLKRQNTILAVATPIVLILLWELAARGGIIDVRFFPPPSSIAVTGWELVENGMLPTALLVTIRTLLIGLVVGNVVGTVVGMAMGTTTTARPHRAGCPDQLQADPARRPRRRCGCRMPQRGHRRARARPWRPGWSSRRSRELRHRARSSSPAGPRRPCGRHFRRRRGTSSGSNPHTVSAGCYDIPCREGPSRPIGRLAR